MIIDVQFVENDASFVALFEENDVSFPVVFEESDSTFTAIFGELFKVYEDVPKYDGGYEVTPKFTEQSLPTAQKFLEKDVTVEKIPYYEVSNNSGGTTVTIG